MAWSFDETNDDVQITDNSLLNLPDGAWTMSGWIKLDDNAGTLYQYLVSWGVVNTANSFNLYYYEESNASFQDILRLHFRSSNNVSITIEESGGTSGTNRDWMHISIERVVDTVRMWIDGVDVGNDTNTSLIATDATGAMYFGGRQDDDPDRRMGGDMAEWAYWNDVNAGRRAALVAGYSPKFFPINRIWHMDMIREYRELDAGLTVTNNGSTIGAHPPIIYPTAQILQFPTVVPPPVGTAFFPLRIRSGFI